MAVFASPLKYNISEKISERKAAMNNNLSVIINFLNMSLIGFMLYEIYENPVQIEKCGLCLK